MMDVTLHQTRTYTIRIPTSNATFFSDIFESEQILVSYIIFVETCAQTLLCPNIWQTVHVYSCAVSESEKGSNLPRIKIKDSETFLTYARFPEE